MSRESVLVSVITPVYNSESYIGDTIKSVMSQTYKNWEMLIVDDCSKDNTAQVIKSFNDSRVKYIRLDVNSGAAVARNKAIAKANGEFIAFLDADDMWKPEKLERQINFMQEHGYTFTSYEILKEPKNKVIEVPTSLDYSHYMKNTVIGMLTVMIDRRKLPNIEIVNIKKDHDSMTWAKLLREGNIAHGLNESLAYYRKVDGSISNNKFEAAKNHWNNCRKVEKLPLIKCSYYFAYYTFNAFKKHFL